MEPSTKPNRQSIRLKGWDYTSSGGYFVTINTHESQAIFGAIINGKMVLNDAGKIAEEEWLKSASIRKEIELDEFVIMPNHMHGIVRLKGFGALQGFGAPSPSFGHPIVGALGTVIGAYKAAVSRAIRRRGLVRQTRPARPIWHRNYWDVIVRDEKALANIRNYIRFNPQNTDVVMNVGEPQSLGDRTLLELPKVGVLSSRGADTPHGRLPVTVGEAIISGFLSPMERAVFNAGLEYKKPLIWVKPWGLEEGTCTGPIRRALDESRLLIISPFTERDAPSVRRAAWCNQYVLNHCRRMVVGHLTPGGMLSCILSEADPELEIIIYSFPRFGPEVSRKCFSYSRKEVTRRGAAKITRGFSKPWKPQMWGDPPQDFFMNRSFLQSFKSRTLTGILSK